MEAVSPAVAVSSPALEVPAWLEERFPKWQWASLRLCSLNVDASIGAGLEMEESELGYHVDAVAASPGQDPTLQPGDVIVAVNGERLLGLPDMDVGEIFGTHFRHGVELLLVRADELRRAVVERNANEECPCEVLDDECEEDGKPEQLANYELLWRTKTPTEYEATVRIPVGRATVWRLSTDLMRNFERDLECLSERYRLIAQLHCNAAGVDSVVLSGLPSAIASARPEVIQILQYYRDGTLGWDGGGPALAHDTVVDHNAGTPVPEGVKRSSFKLPEHVRDVRQFMYHDHTADIIVHAWGKTRAESFEQVCVGMFQYMTDLDKVDFDRSVDIEAQGHDLLDLLYHLLDEFLYVFGTEMHVSRCVEILSFDEDNFRIRARGYGEKMDLKKHEQGTEIKAITMHMMKILGPETVMSEHGTAGRAETRDEVREGFPHEAYVLLDI